MYEYRGYSWVERVDALVANGEYISILSLNKHIMSREGGCFSGYRRIHFYLITKNMYEYRGYSWVERVDALVATGEYISILSLKTCMSTEDTVE